MKLIYKIVLILSIAALKLNAADASFFDDRTKPGDDKKVKKAKDDTTKFVVNEEVLTETPDTNLILFPSNDIYASWDTVSAHPYSFYDAFKMDSVTICLTVDGDGGFAVPAKGLVTSEFGWRRYRPHYGTDIDLETGDTVVSAFDGMVRISKSYYGYGNCVIVRHNNGIETVYGHLSKLLVEPGQIVKAGEIIGLGGNTGRSTGSHLHWEMRYLGQALDAQDFVDFEKGVLKQSSFVLRKSDVENKYDLRALHGRHKRDIGLTKAELALAKKQGYRKIYKVRKGDTLSRIAKRNHTTVKAICKKNKLKPNSKLRLGQKIKI